MAKCKFVVIPPENRESAVVEARCKECKEVFPLAELNKHAAEEHRALSVDLDTTINWSEIDRKRRKASHGA